MADPALVAALKRRQQQAAEQAAAEQAARDHAAEMARQSVTDQTMSPWATIGQGALDTLGNYATDVYNAAMPQLERAQQGYADVTSAAPIKTGSPLIDLFSGAASKGLKGEGIDAANKIADVGFGAANAAFSPLAPPMEAALSPVLNSETGKGLLSGVGDFNEAISKHTGITPQNLADAELWFALPAAGKALGKGFHGMASKIIDAAEGAPKAPPGALPAPFDGTADLRTQIDQGRQLNNQTASQFDPRTLPDLTIADPNVHAPDEIAGDVFHRMRGNINTAFEGPSMRDIGLKAADDMPSSGDHLASQYRDWAKDAGGTIDDALSALESEKQAWPAGLYNDAVIRLTKEAEDAAGREPTPQDLAREYRQAAKDHGISAVDLLDDERSAWSPELHKATRDLLSQEPRGPAQSVDALLPPETKKGGPASADVKVKPGQSLWDAINENPEAFSDADRIRGLTAPRVPTLEDFQNVPLPKDHVYENADGNSRMPKGQALPRGGEEPLVGLDGKPVEFDPSNGRTVPPTTTVMPEGSMYGDPSGYKNVNIRTNPSIKDVAKAIDENKSWKEARYLIEPDGAMHFWPANAAYHNDVGEFLGADADNGFHGTMTRRQYDAAMAHNPKTLEDLVRLGGDQYLDSWIQDMGLANRQEWRDAGQAYIDSFQPKPKASMSERIKATWQATMKKLEKEGKVQPQEPPPSPVEQFDSGAVDQPVAPVAPPKNWRERQERLQAQGEGAIEEKRNRAMPRGKGEPLISMRGYTERQAKMLSPVEQFDNPDPQSGEIAAAKAKSAEMNAYKADQPPATKPERAAEQKAAFRERWLNPDRPHDVETTPQLPNINAARKKVDQSFLASREKAFEEHEGDITPKTLAEKVGKAIKEHLAMTPEQRRINLQLAEQKLLKYMPNQNGRPSDFMNENAKLEKAATLPNGQGVESTGLSLSPSTEMKGFKTCPNSAACREACLGLKSGQYHLGGEEGGAQSASRYRTTALLSLPEASAVKIFEDIAARQRSAAANGNVLGVRMNVLSDVDPKVWKPLFDHFKDAVFYDYTKMKYEPVAPNHIYAYSSTGVSSDMVSNAHANWSQMRNRLDAGDNVAMAFSTKKTFPKWVVDEETGKRYRVVDGVSHDFRPIDLQDAGKEGVIIGLKNMEQTTKEATAHEQTGGFIVHYDPQWKRSSPRSGARMVRDEEGNQIAQNDTVYIQTQPSKESLRSAKPGESGTKTGPQTQITIRGEDRTPVQNQKALTLEDFSPKEELKKREQAVQDITDRMYARLNMFDHAPKMDKNQPRKLFSEEYPDWKGEDHGTRVETDIDGQPINPDAMIVGRQTKGGADKGHSPRAYKAMAERMMNDFNPENNRGVFRRKKEQSRVGGTFKFSKGSQTGKTYPEGIEINSATPEWLQDQTLAHEIGHMIDFMSMNAADKYFKHVNSRTGGQVTKYDPKGMPTRDLMKPVEDELRDLYSEVNENFGTYIDHRKGMPNTPERSGYESHLAPSELIAEAFRVYMYDPGYIKARYPKAAEFLRQIVRDNPQVAKHIHFNEMGGGLAGVMAMKYLADKQQQDNR